jgi:hypothetical protein
VKQFVRVLAVAGTLSAILVPAATASAATTTTTVVRAPSGAVVGAPANVVATIKPAPASGTVRFSVEGSGVVPGCNAVAVSAGKALCKVTLTSKTPVRVSARYNGTADSAASAGGVQVTPTDGAQGQLVGGVGACTRKTGALVAVSYGAWSGPIVRGCDTTLTTGIDLLNTAGFTTTGTVHDGPAFLCRIGHAYWDAGTEYPTPATEACVATPPANAYWSYWIAPRGQNTWSYSAWGAYSSHPTAGSVEAWTFGATDIAGTTGQPNFTPNEVRAGLPVS